MFTEKEINKFIKFLESENLFYERNIAYWAKKENLENFEKDEQKSQEILLKENENTIQKLKNIKW